MTEEITEIIAGIIAIVLFIIPIIIMIKKAGKEFNEDIRKIRVARDYDLFIKNLPSFTIDNQLKDELSRPDRDLANLVHNRNEILTVKQPKKIYIRR